MRIVVVLLALSLVFAAPEGDAPAQGPPKKQVPGPEHRQFDFWIGEWTVTSQGGFAGKNVITSAEGGFALIEKWSGAGGGTGTSLNYYDRADKEWHQTWIDSSGNALTLSGGLVDGKMVLSSEPADHPQGGKVVQRVTWTPLEGGKKVRQHWESSRDGGKTWSTVFDGLYSK